MAQCPCESSSVVSRSYNVLNLLSSNESMVCSSGARRYSTGMCCVRIYRRWNPTNYIWRNDWVRKIFQWSKYPLLCILYQFYFCISKNFTVKITSLIYLCCSLFLLFLGGNMFERLSVQVFFAEKNLYK